MRLRIVRPLREEPLVQSSWVVLDGVCLEDVFSIETLSSSHAFPSERAVPACIEDGVEVRSSAVQALGRVTGTRAQNFFCFLPFLFFRRHFGE